MRHMSGVGLRGVLGRGESDWRSVSLGRAKSAARRGDGGCFHRHARRQAGVGACEALQGSAGADRRRSRDRSGAKAPRGHKRVRSDGRGLAPASVETR